MMMKGKTKSPAKASHTRYRTEFMQQALARATQDGVAVAVKDLGLQESQIYAWRIKARAACQRLVCSAPMDSR